MVPLPWHAAGGELVVRSEAQREALQGKSVGIQDEGSMYTGHTGALGEIYFCAVPVLKRWNPQTRQETFVRTLADTHPCHRHCCNTCAGTHSDLGHEKLYAERD